MAGPVSFNGLMSGIDTESIIQRLMEIERQPLRLIELRQAETEQKLGFYRDLRSRLESLDASVNALNLASAVSAKSAASSDTTALTVSASSAASVGTYTINSIDSLATTESFASIGVQDSTAAFAGGSVFKFSVGSETFTITLGEDEKTLEGLRDAINAEAEGVATASIINTGDADDPYKLLIAADQSGAGQDISIDDGTTDIVVTTSSGDADLTLAQTTNGVDAQFKVNGITVTRSSNTVSDAIEGVTLQLLAESADPITVSVTQDTDTLKTRLEDVIEKYNEINSLIQAQYTLDSETGQAGPMSGDFTLRSIQQTLQQTLVGGVTDADGNRYSVASLGIDIDKYTGALELDEDRFNQAVTDNDASMFVTLFLATGSATDGRVSYTSSTHDTQAGTYAINISGYDDDGNVQGTFTKGGTVYTGVGNGQYLVGATGTDAEGLRIRIASGATGDLGSVYFTVGVAERFERELDGLITPLIGDLPKIEDQLEDDITGIIDEIAAFEDRLAVRELELIQRFAAAEEAIAALQSQSQAFTQQLAALNG